MIRVGFDGRALVSPAAGIRRYTWELFGALASLEGLEVVAVGAPQDTTLPPGVLRTDGALALPTNVGWMVTGLPRAARRALVDLFHAPSYTAPLGGPRPLVLTIHDVSYARHPEWYPYRRDPLRRAFYRWSARSADRVVTDSLFSRSEIEAAYRLPVSSIDVVPLAAAPIFSEGPPLPLPPGVSPPFLLHVGDLHARRNIGIAARAVARLGRDSSGRGPVQLVLAGVDRRADRPIVHAEADQGTGPVSVVHVESADDRDLLALYRAASALVYPSKYEGFGLPVLEAMACGTPVVASRAASIPEVAGDAAILLDPDDDDAWVAAIESVLDRTGATSVRLREAGLRRAAAFTWRRTAEQTAEVYRRALGVAS